MFPDGGARLADGDAAPGSSAADGAVLAPLPPDAAAELAVLTSLVTHSDGFALAVVTVDDDEYQDRLIAACRHDAAPKTIAVIDVGELGVDAGLGGRIVAAAMGADAAFLVGIGPLVDPGADDQPVLAQLDLARNRLGTSLGCPMVLWAPTYVLAALPFRAPNLWSWTTMCVAFPLDDTTGAAHVARPRPVSPPAVDQRRDEARLRQALDDLGPGGSPAVRAALLERLGDVAAALGRYDEATTNYTLAQTTYHLLGDQLGEANAIQALGDIARMQDRHDEATTNYTLAQTTYHDLGNRLGEANTINSLGEIARLHGRYDDATANYTIARTAYHELGNRLGEATTIQALGDIAYMQGRYDDATTNYTIARTTYHELGNRAGEANTINSLGDIARMQDRYDDATANYNLAHTTYRQLGNRAGEANTIKALGDIARMQDRYDDATANYNVARTTYHDLGNRAGEANTIRALGDIASMQGRYDEATDLYQQALPVYRELGDRVGEANTLLSMGRLARAEGRHDEARRLLQQAAHGYRIVGNDEWAQCADDEADAVTS